MKRLMGSTNWKRIGLMFVKGFLALLAPGEFLAAGAQKYADDLSAEDTKRKLEHLAFLHKYRKEREGKPHRKHV